MRLTVIGAGPAYSDHAGSSGACYLVSEGGAHVLLDLGHGSFSRIFGYIQPTEIDVVIVSHLHPDHFVDLVPFRHYLRYQFEPPRRVQVLAPPRLTARLDALHDEDGFCAAALDVVALREGRQTVGPFTLEATRVRHTADSHAFRLTTTDAPGLVYSGDCGRADDLAPLIRPGDTLLTEASFGAGPVPAGVQHLDGPAVGRVAAATGAGRVLLTHLLMGHDPGATIASVRRRFAGPVELVSPGTQLEI